MGASFATASGQVLDDGVTLRFVGREDSASPATGSADSHKLEQKMILDEAFAST